MILGGDSLRAWVVYLGLLDFLSEFPNAWKIRSS